MLKIVWKWAKMPKIAHKKAKKIFFFRVKKLAQLWKVWTGGASAATTFFHLCTHLGKPLPALEWDEQTQCCGEWRSEQLYVLQGCILIGIVFFLLNKLCHFNQLWHLIETQIWLKGLNLLSKLKATPIKIQPWTYTRVWPALTCCNWAEIGLK